ncbi:GerAB/ArcD/ProY family transporter [Bacillus sp. FJAT-45350]|uniref:GerAB/ArcD/ProY family transporter n=1 Tax=Bacillus sp. FJAT-45350 TaxID=2011014 RepID=UPI000BB69333|nr:GerAB/ArcD/ProY family transporter [Bacillus sp. FJAT-45350]
MNQPDQYQITPLEMAVVLMSMITGVGILTIPRSLTSALETPDGWISIIIAGIIFMFIVYLFVKLQQQIPGQTVFTYLEQGKIGKWFAFILTLGFAIYFISLLAFEARILALVAKMYLLDQTPSEALVAIILLTTTYAVTKGVQGVVHLCLMFTPIILLLGFVMLLANLPNVEFERMLPIMGEGITPVLLGLSEISLSFLGVELLLFLMVYMNKSKVRALPFNLSIGLITISYVLTFMVVVSIFGVNGSQIVTFPTVEAVKEVEVPGAFFERLESLMITIWIMTIFNTMTVAQLLLVHLLKDKLMTKKKKLVLPVVVFLTYLIAFIPNSIADLFMMGDWLGYLGVGLIFFSLVVGFLTIFFRKKKIVTQDAKGV